MTPPVVVPQRYEPAVDVATLQEWPGNPNEGADDLVGESLDQLGFYGAVLVQASTRRVIAGNTRLRRARAGGMPALPVIWADVDDDTAARMLLVDNEAARRGRWDEARLVSFLQPLAASGRELAGTGFGAGDLAALVRRLGGPPGPGLGDPDDIPEPPPEPVSAYGDLLLLGANRLLCGDATSPGDVARVTEGMGTVGIVYADPPYGINSVSTSLKVSGDGRSFGKIASPLGTAFGGGKQGKIIQSTVYRPVTGDETTDTARDAFTLLHATYPRAAHVWWGGNHYAASAGLPDSSCWLVWDKETGDNSFADAELAWTNHLGAVRLIRHTWNGLVRASERGKRVHPNQKPVTVAEWAFSVIDPKGERTLVLDTFAGSGSTVIAAHNTGRTAALIEIEPAYVDIIAARWQRATGIKPKRVRPDGTTEPATFTWPGDA